MDTVRIAKDAICPKCKASLSGWMTDGGIMYRHCRSCQICFIPIDLGRADHDTICKIIPAANFFHMVK